MAKSRGRKFAEITSPSSGVFDLTSVPTITNAKLQNSAMTLAGSSVSLGGTGVANTDALSEGSSNLYFTNARVQSFLGGGTLAGNIVVPDNQSIYVGSSSDFRIIHNTTNTQLTNATGALQITSNGGITVTGATTFSADLTVDTDTLKVDSTNNRVGIGVASPGAALSVSGLASLANLGGGSTGSAAIYVNSTSGHTGEMLQILKNGSTRMEMTNAGNLGIGESSPSAKFHLKKTAASTQHYDQYATAIIEDTEARLQIVASEGGSNASGLLLTNEAKHWGLVHHGTGNSNIFSIGYYATSSNNTDISDNLNDILNISTGGDVGIGTDAPASILHIEGSTNSYATAPVLYFGSTSTANAAVRDWAIGPADSNYGDFHIFQGASTGASALATSNSKFMIDSVGNVSIGNAGAAIPAAANLYIKDASDSRVIIYESGTSPYTATLELASQGIGTYGGLVQYTSNAERLTIQNYGRTVSSGSYNGSIAFKTKVSNTTPTEVMFIHGFTGNVGIGTTQPGAKLDIAHSTINQAALRVYNSHSSGAYGLLVDNTAHSSGSTYYVADFRAAGSSRFKIPNDGNVIINHGSFSSLPTGSKLNVFGDGEVFRIDGSGATSRKIRFRNVSDANPGIIIADGSLKLETEDANTDIRLSAVRDIEYQVTSANTTAGFHLFKSYNTTIMAIDGGNNRVGINVEKSGNSVPQKTFHVEHAAGASEGILISGASDTTGHTAGILLRAEGGEADSALRAKGGIFFERTGTYGVGKLHLANDTGGDNTSATTADAKLTIDDEGRVQLAKSSLYFYPSSMGKYEVRTGGNQGSGTYTLFTNGATNTQSSGIVEVWGIYGTPSHAGYRKYLISGNRSITTLISYTQTGGVGDPSVTWNGATLQVSNSNSNIYFHVRVELHQIGNGWAPTWGNLSGIG